MSGYSDDEFDGQTSPVRSPQRRNVANDRFERGTSKAVSRLDVDEEEERYNGPRYLIAEKGRTGTTLKAVKQLAPTVRSLDELSSWNSVFSSANKKKPVKKKAWSLKRTSDLAKPKPPSAPGDSTWEVLDWMKKYVKCTCRGERKKKCTLTNPQPRCARAKALHAKEDDAKHCRFTPSIKKRKKNSDEDAEGGGSSNSFLERMESLEKTKKAKLAKERAKADYDAKVGKLVCSTCGNDQTYDEFIQEKKRCQRDGGLFRNPRVWSDFRENFLRKLDESVEKKHKTTATTETVKSKTAGNKLSWNKVKHSFLSRMEQDARQRLGKLAAAEDKLTRVDPNCTFKPTLSASTSARSMGSFEERMESDIRKRKKKEAKFTGLVSSMMAATIKKKKKARGHKQQASDY